MKACLALFLLLTNILMAQGKCQLDTINQLMQQKKHEAAITSLHQVLSRGYESADIYYNLGTAYLKTNDIGRAVLFLSKANLYQPNDSAIVLNLNIAKAKRLTQSVETQSTWIGQLYDKMLYGVSGNLLAVLSIIIAFCIVPLVYMWLFFKNRNYRKIGFFSLIPVLFLLVALLIITIQKNTMLQRDGISVVINNGVALLEGPAGLSTQLMVNSGDEVKILKIKGNFVKIRLTLGQEGWLDISNILSI